MPPRRGIRPGSAHAVRISALPLLSSDASSGPTPPARRARSGDSLAARRLLAGCLGAALGLTILLAASTSAQPAERSLRLNRAFAVSDTDSVRVDFPDSLRALPRLDPDSLLALGDSTLADSLRRQRLLERYLPRFRGDARSAQISDRQRPLLPPIGSILRRQTVLDSANYVYTVSERVGEREVRVPLRIGIDEYASQRFERAKATNFEALLGRRSQQQRNGVGPLVNITIPGGRQSAFTTIFGKNEVSIRVNGSADINAGFDARKSDQLAASGQDGFRVDPNFRQNLRLSIIGSIGDKLRVDVNWDTENQFEYQNQVKLVYTGYEDEIIQSIEAGNVFLQTPSTLIRGGQSLFGLKTRLQLGRLSLTGVASQQEGQSNTKTISGGSERTEFDLRPSDYDENRHYFLAYYFRNWYERALSQPPNKIVGDVRQVERIEVWKLDQESEQDLNARNIVALVDLNEIETILNQTPDNLYLTAAAPTPQRDQYSEADLATLKNANDDNAINNLLQDKKGLSSKDFQTGKFRLLSASDYDFDPVLGYLSLRQQLRPSEALAVSYRYVNSQGAGQAVKVGELVSETGGTDGSLDDTRLIAKLLRPAEPLAPTEASVPAPWYLEMRNIYPLRGGRLRQSDFELDVVYQPSAGQPSETLPAGIGGTTTLLEHLGLDRIRQDESLGSDTQFDYIVRYTIDEDNGRIIFPYLEPFGQRILDVSGPRVEEARQLLAFTSLYTTKQETARRETKFDVFRIQGSFQGAAQSFFDLRAFNGLIEGSVRVTAGGSELREGADYTVDYSGSGTVNIINPGLLSDGREIAIDFEQNNIFNIQQKTLLGARAEYALPNRLQLGATVFNLSQRSQIDKFRLGEEPISNTIWGLDGRFQADPDWLTRAVDALPFLQTRAPSSIDIKGEFAQLLPGNPQTTAFRQTRRDLTDRGLDFYADELDGLSTIDDFESFENTTSLRTPGTWRIASAPDSIGIVDPVMAGTNTPDIVARTYWRSALAWYQIQASNEVRNIEALRQVDIQEVFPNVDVRNLSQAERVQPTLDMFLDPRIRGPYNYNPDLAEFFQKPSETWGGMMTGIPDGFSDFALKNVEFVEFIFKPISEGGTVRPGAILNVDLGAISEDVIPDGRPNSEDGLAFRPNDPIADIAPGALARRPAKSSNGSVDFDKDSGRTEDLGLDGFVSYDISRYPDNPQIHEVVHFAPWLSAIQAQAPVSEWHQAEIQRSLFDPSADDYFHFSDRLFYENRAFFPQSLGQHRFLRLFPGLELNAQQTQRELAREDRTDAIIGNSRYPDTEDLNRGSSFDLANDYFQYTVPLDEATLDELGSPLRDDDFVVGEIRRDDGTGTGWYQVRIPVRDFTRRVGDIEDFRGIETIRMWITGVDKPTTLRFATLELVGSQWEKSTSFSDERGAPSDTATVSISSVNTEENSGLYQTPNGVVINRILSQGAQGARLAREQSLVLEAENLGPGIQAGITKPYSERPLDLLKYSNIRMFAHLNGRASNRALDGEKDRGKVNLVLRLGSNESTDYYEYEQPLTPTLIPAGTSDELWRNSVNAVNIEIAALNQLKFERNQRGIPFESTFTAEPGNDEGLPDPEEFAPPGTRLSLRGNPTLDRVTTVTIGLRNPADSTDFDNPALRVQRAVVWVNELRVTGYDERAGASGLASVNLQLADFATLRGNYQQQTDGFGALTSTLSERDQNASVNYALSTDLRMDKFLPQSAGWSLPVSLSYQTGTTTPRFSPTRGDVALDAILEGIDNQEFDADQRPLTDEDRQRLRRNELEAAQTIRSTRTASFRASKSGSKTTLLRHTVDALTIGYATSSTDARSPRNRLNDTWNWSSTLSYTLPNQDPRTLRPFWLLDELPFVGKLGGLRFNYVPSTFGFTAQAQRSFAQQQQRPSLLAVRADSIPERQTNPFREQHQFTHGRDFSLQYNPFSFLRTSFDTGVSQVLSIVGVDTVYQLVTVGDDGSDVFTPLSPGEAAKRRNDSTFVAAGGFIEERVRAIGFGQTVGRVFSGDDRFRTDSYRQNFTATLTLRLPQSITWASLTPTSYNSRYTWNNGAAGQNLGATVSNGTSVSTGLTLRPNDFFGTFDWFKGFEDEQQQAERDAEQRRQEAERARELAKTERAARREAEAAEEAALEAARLAAIEAVIDAADQTPAVEAEDEVIDPTGDVPPTRDMLDENVIGGEVNPNAPGVEIGEAAVADSSDERRGFRITLPSGRSILRRSILALGGTRDLTIRYTGRFASASNGIVDEGDSLATAYNFFDAARGRGPALGYRFGLERRIDPEDRFYGDVLVRDNLQDDHNFQASTALNLSTSLTVNLAWDLSWNQNRQINLALSEGNLLSQTEDRSGGAGTLVWAFGSSYRDLFAAQQRTLQGDLSGLSGDTLRDTNGDGRVVLTNGSVVTDFVSAYTAGPGTVGLNGLLPFPMPSWQINYSGLAKLPILNRFAQSASLRHGYSANYATNYVSNPPGAESVFRLPRSFAVAFEQPEIEATSVNINERWSPLIGADVRWKGGLSTNFAYNRSDLHSLVTSSYEVSKRSTNELSASVNWQKQGLRLPFFNRLNNRVTFQMAVARSVNNELTRKLQPAIADAADPTLGFTPEDALGNTYIGLDQTTTRLTLTPTVQYQFSNTVSGTFSLKYEQFESEASNVGSFSTLTGLFSVRVSISSN